jgi:hypothetical protein
MTVPFDQVQAPPAPPVPPTNTPAPTTVSNTPAPTADPSPRVGVPRTTEEVRALRNQRSELSSQLNSAANRREELVEQLEGATGASRAGIEARIKLLDERILQIEGDIASTGQLLAQARGQILVQDTPPSPGGFMNVDVTAVTAILSVFVLGPLAIVYARNLWKRGSSSKVETLLERENSDRLARLESAVDAIAIEMERVSEGQRFVTKLLAESGNREKARIERQ